MTVKELKDILEAYEDEHIVFTEYDGVFTTIDHTTSFGYRVIGNEFEIFENSDIIGVSLA